MAGFEPLAEELVRKSLAEAAQEDLSYSHGRIFGSMYTTPHEKALEGHKMFLEANLGNPGLFPGTAKLEREVISILAGLMHHHGADGYITSGGTESNITALWIARKLANGNLDVMVPRSAHFSVFKAIDLLGMNRVDIDLDSEFRMDLTDLENKLSKHQTAAVVAVAGTTELGVVDPIEKIGEMLDGTRIYLHVDAAFGGFVLPFMDKPAPPFDFSVKQVSSITLDPHKMGLSTPPAGGFLVRKPSWLDLTAFSSPYLTQEKALSLLGTRASASVASCWAVLRSLGHVGYVEVVSECMDKTRYLAKRLGEEGFDLVMEPLMNIVAIRTGKRLSSPAEVCKHMATRGWNLSMSVHPKALRMVVMPHINRINIDELILDLLEITHHLRPEVKV